MALLRPRQLRGHLEAFPSQFWLLATAYFLLWIGISTVLPFESTYLNRVLGMPMSLVGPLLGMPMIVVLPLHMLGGALTDRFGRRLVMIAGATIVPSVFLVFAFSPGPAQLALVLGLESVFGWPLFQTASNAMLADIILPERRPEAYGLGRAAMSIGSVIGPLLAGVLLAVHAGYRAVFLAGTAFCMLVVLVLLPGLKETGPPKVRGVTLRDTLHSYGRVLRDRRFLLLCVLSLFPLYGMAQLTSTLPISLYESHNITPGAWSLLYAVYSGIVGLLQYPVIRRLGNGDRPTLMAVCSLLVGMAIAAAVLVPYGPLTYLCMIVYAFGVMVFIPIALAFAAELAPVHLRGRYMGAWTLVQMGGYALGTTLGGVALGALATVGAALVVAISGIVGAVAFASLRARMRPPHPEPATSAFGMPSAEESGF